MRLTRWRLRFLPVWTFFLGLLIGGLPGGLARIDNYVAIGLYVLVTAVVWVPLGWLPRQDSAPTPPTPTT
ncbi:hypothetical protein ACGIF2_09720 [Cellulomonas sp. P22]|uniref:hypothetical protein n=1 Tax=Cellulomonas sp. P22 TaxID=3373189 RepID=UPI0037A7DE23